MKTTLLTLLSACVLTGSAWAQAEPDNTGTNARDRDGQKLTATDQSNKPEDIKITADIRKMVVDDASLSLGAKNIKIITIDGVVTLRGPVETAAEKSAIEAHAKHASPVKIVNEIEIKKS